jgi:hypothetical protein
MNLNHVSDPPHNDRPMRSWGVWEWMDPNRWLQLLFNRRDLNIIREIHGLPSLTERQKAAIREGLWRCSANSGYKVVARRLFSDLLNGSPINLMELEALYTSVQSASGEPTWLTWTPTNEFTPDERAFFGTLKAILKRHYEEMLVEKSQLKSRDRIVAGQDMLEFQLRTIVLATFAAIASAVASIASALLAYLQYRRG